MSEPAMILAEVAVRRVERLSPSFVRVELGGDCLEDLGVQGPWLDQRFKLIFPNAAGALPDLVADEDWWARWTELPEDERGAMRTYTVRDVVGSGPKTGLVVDIVVHDPGPNDEHTGPGNSWAWRAAVGDMLLVLAPRRGQESGGREFDPGPASRLLLAADETALPAVAGILRDLGPDARGTALLEVPTSDDVLPLTGPDGVDIFWLPRDGAVRGERLHACAASLLGTPALGGGARETGRAEVGHSGAGRGEDGQSEADLMLWETPHYSSGGEQIDPDRSDAAPHSGLYAWIAGESTIVTGLRRHLVKDLGVDRSQVAFMGYWREGVAMRG